MAKVSASSVVGGSVEDVWKVVGEFGGISKWHPAIAASAIVSGDGDSAGSIRECTLGDGGKLREEQLERSDARSLLHLQHHRSAHADRELHW